MVKLVIRLLLLIGTVPLFSAQDKPQEQKILFTSIPKAGTHLLKKAIQLITGNVPIRWIGIAKVKEFNARVDLRMPNRITGSHLFPEIDQVRTRFSDRYKKVLIIRDPRDVMVSFMHHLLKRMIWCGYTQFDYNHFETLPLEERMKETLLFPDEFRNPKTCFQYAAEWMKDPTVFVCRFEDLVGPKGGGNKKKQHETLAALATYLGYSLSKKEISSIASQLFGGTWTFRKGKIGGWKKYYNKENKRLFKELMGEAVVNLGYEKSDNW